MIAVRSGSVPRSTGFEYVEETTVKDKGGATVRTTRTIAGDGWWWWQLYVAARSISVQGDGKALVLQMLKEAKECGLIETTKGIYATMVARSDLDHNMETIRAVGFQLCRIITDLQARLNQMGHRLHVVEYQVEE
jgi:hypothetical protein